jgi:DNA-binding response OmpR family regulator
MARGRFVAVVGYGPDLEREGGSASVLRQLGADVRTLDLWADAAELFAFHGGASQRLEAVARAIVVEVGARPDLGPLVLRGLRREPRLDGVGAILALDHTHVSRHDPTSGFDDFVLLPLVPAELYARVRAVEWKRSEFSTEERLKVGELVIDRAAREVLVAGTVVALTAREFDLLVFLADRRGRVVRRAELLEGVWGPSYEGGPRTIDIHVRRLRAKLGGAFELTTSRGTGYRLVGPGGSHP